MQPIVGSFFLSKCSPLVKFVRSTSNQVRIFWRGNLGFELEHVFVLETTMKAPKMKSQKLIVMVRVGVCSDEPVLRGYLTSLAPPTNGSRRINQRKSQGRALVLSQRLLPRTYHL